MRKLIVTGAVLFATSAFAQQDLSKVEIKVERVACTAYMLSGQGGNNGVSGGDDGMVLADDEYAAIVPKLMRDAEERRSRSRQSPRRRENHPRPWTAGRQSGSTRVRRHAPRND